MMTYDEFKRYVAEHIREYLPEEYASGTVRILKTRKNNNVMLDGLSIRTSDEVTPVYYLNPAYERYCHGTPMPEIMSRTAQEYLASVCQSPYGIGSHVEDMVKALTSYDAVKEKISARVCSVRENADYLLRVPHTILEDLAVTYSVVLDKGEGGIYSVAIDNAMFENYGITREELHRQAMVNIETEKVRLEPLYKMIMDLAVSDMMRNTGLSRQQAIEMVESLEGDIEEVQDIYVLTNPDGVNGAVLMLSEKSMQETGEKLEEDFYVLPSSIHEVLIVPLSSEINPEELRRMVKMVNDTEVRPEEKLSDNVYRYDTKQKQLQLVPPETQHEHDREIEKKNTRCR